MLILDLCPVGCTECSQAAGCTACSPEYILSGGTCVCTTAGGGADCQICSLTKCNLCKIGYFLDSKTGNCVTSCPNGYYNEVFNDLRSCQLCSSLYNNCKFCTASACTICDAGYYVNTRTGFCFPCGLNFCSTCTNGTPVSCSLCLPGYFLITTLSITNPQIFSCIESCPTEKYYQDDLQC